MAMVITNIDSRIKRFADLLVGETFKVGNSVFLKGAYDLQAWFAAYGQSPNPVESQDLWVPPATVAVASAELVGYEAAKAIDRLRDTLWLVDQPNIPASIELQFGVATEVPAFYAWDAYGNIGRWQVEHWSGVAWVVNTLGEGITNGDAVALTTSVTTLKIRFTILSQSSLGFVGLREIGVGRPYLTNPTFLTGVDNNHVGVLTGDIAWKAVREDSTYWSFLADVLPTTFTLTFATAQDLKGILLSDLRRNISAWSLSYWDGLAWAPAASGTTVGDLVNNWQETEFAHQSSLQWQLTISGVTPDAYPTPLVVSDSSHMGTSVGANATAYPMTAAYWEAVVGALPANVDATLPATAWVKGVRLTDPLGTIAGYDVEYWNGAAWINAYSGTTITNGADVLFAAPVESGRLRLIVTAVSSGATFQVSQFHFILSTEVRVSTIQVSPALPTPLPAPDFTGFRTDANAVNLSLNSLVRFEPQDQVEATPTQLTVLEGSAVTFG